MPSLSSKDSAKITRPVLLQFNRKLSCRYALDKIISYYFHGNLVCWAILFASPVCVSRDVRRSAWQRAFQDNGEKIILWHHDAGRGSHSRFWRMAVARLRLLRQLALR